MTARLTATERFHAENHLELPDGDWADVALRLDAALKAAEQERDELRVLVEGYRPAVEERDDLRAEVQRLRDGIEQAWGIIANVSGGDWTHEQTTEWQSAAARFRDEVFHLMVAGIREADKEVGK